MSALAPETVDIAAALARHATQGRDLRAAVVAWFVEAGHPTVAGEPSVPEPPDAAVVEALGWAVRADTGYRLLRRARAAVTEAQQDDFYAAADAQVRRRGGAAAGFDPSAMRAALLSGEDIPSVSHGARTEIVHFIAALGLGVEEVTPEVFADAIAATGLFPQLSAKEWREAMIEAAASDSSAQAFAALTSFDLAEVVENAGIVQLRQAREAAIGLAGFGALLMGHALLMPDTPGLAALRTKINQLAAGPILMSLARQVMQPQQAALAIAACLQPDYLALYTSLSEAVAAGPPLLHEAGNDEHDPQQYIDTWLTSIRQLGEQGETGEGS